MILLQGLFELANLVLSVLSQELSGSGIIRGMKKLLKTNYANLPAIDH
jgi:hypothetical protein